MNAELPADDGLTISGELDSDGLPSAIIRGAGTGVSGCFAVNECIVWLGEDGTAEVAMEHFEVRQGGTTGGADVTPIFLAGGSDLMTVDIPFIRDVDTNAAVEICDQTGSVIDSSLLDAIGTDATGVYGCAGAEIVDSTIVNDVAPTIAQLSSPDLGSTITRSFVGSDPAAPSGAPVIDASSDLTVDSSVVAGGEIGLGYFGDEGATWEINNSTIDAGEFGEEDPSPFAGMVLNPLGPDEMTVNVNSSILVEELVGQPAGGPATVTCGYTNLPATDLAPPDYTDECPLAGEPGSTNTNTSPGNLFVGPSGSFISGFDWSLRAGSPAVDGGQPGPLSPQFSQTDFDGNPRLVPGTAATCPTGIRDQGAFERASDCERTLTVSTTGTGFGKVTGPGIDCGEGATDCTETVAVGATIELTAAAADGSSFDGFAGGGARRAPAA